MADLTREQIEAWLVQAEANDWGADMSTDDQVDVLRLALRALDQEREALEVVATLTAQRDKALAERLPFYLLAEHDGAYPERCALCGIEYDDDDDREGVEAIHAEDCPQNADVLASGAHAVVRCLLDLVTTARLERDARPPITQAMARELTDMMVTYDFDMACLREGGLADQASDILHAHGHAHGARAVEGES